MLPLATRLCNLFVLCLIVFDFIPKVYGQRPTPIQQQAILLHRVLENYHYQPRTLDEAFSKQVFYHFTELLDPRHLYFTAADIQELSKRSLQIGDELRGKSWLFLPLATKLYRQRLTEADKIVESTLQKPFDFSANEFISFPPKDSFSFATSEKDYALRWHHWLKYQTLLHLTDIRQINRLTDPDKTTAVAVKEPLVRQKVQQIEKRDIKRMLEDPAGFENYVSTLFFNAITLCHDPHSNYLSKTDRENFESALSTEAFSFGVDLEESNAGEVVIGRLVPGGPAWKSSELHKGDILIALTWSGKNPVDLSGAQVEEVESMLQSSNEARLEITVRKTNGITKTVSLIKEKIREDENVVKSYVLKGDKKIGYISLPGFYTEWENASGQGCANDVAKEVVKLQQENVEGLILDIRYNGGGSLLEGTNLAGIFINEGPLCLLRDREAKPTILKDMNRGTIYDGPLVVLVNGQSASASEVLASTLQDYNRAVIVGSPTFGKATGQIIIPLDSTISPAASQERKSKSPYGFATVTIEKLYRVTGKSAQLKGVQPNVMLPDMYESLTSREDSYPFALPSDSIHKKVYYTPLPALPTAALVRKSADRITRHPSFQTIKKLSRSPEGLADEPDERIPLQLSYFKNKMTESYRWWQELEKAMKQVSTQYTIENTSYDKEIMRMDTYRQEVNDLSMQTIVTDIYIAEAYQITTDLITLQTNSR